MLLFGAITKQKVKPKMTHSLRVVVIEGTEHLADFKVLKF